MKSDDRIYCARIFELVEQIPFGQVMTYGQIAELLGGQFSAKVVCLALHAAGGEKIPWQRVITSQGSCATSKIFLPYNAQQKLLEAEGVLFDEKLRCDLKKYQWSPQKFESSIKPEAVQPSLFG
ncbi:MAG TPA: MGMT family protein [Pyrinomonadaceae bacterium]|jgi:methylated-DNA-protein-cysteine methyltransferase-like protein